MNNREQFLGRAAIAGGLALGSFSVASSAESADPVCNPSKGYEYSIVIRRVPFYDLGGKAGSFDKGIDPWLEIPVTGGGVKAVERSSGEVLVENNYTLQKPNVPANLFQPKQEEQDVAWSLLKWQGNCDVDTTRPTPNGGQRVIPGKEVIIVTTQDPDNRTFLWTAAAGGVDSVWTGRAYKDAPQFLLDYDKHSKQARGLSPETLESIRQQVRQLTQKTEEQQKIAALEETVRKLQDKVDKGQVAEEVESADKQVSNQNLLDQVKFVADLPAIGVDQVTDPDFGQPIRAIEDVLGWLLLLTPMRVSLMGIRPGYLRTAAWRTIRYPFRLLQERRAHDQAAAAAPAGTHVVWSWPSWR